MRVSKQFITISVLLVLLTITCCANNYLNAFTYDEDMILLDKDGNTQYFWKYVNDDCVIYAKEKGAKEAREIAIFPPGSVEYYTYYERNEVVSFGICGEWLVASVGFYAGSANNFLGDFVRFKRDGSELTHFRLTASDRFIILGDWIYYNFFEYQDKPEYITGCYRIKPDETDKQYLGDILSTVIAKDEDGYLYGEHDTDKWVNGWNPVKNLIRWKQGDSEFTTLFEGATLPEFDDSYSISYWDIKIKNKYILFTPVVYGYSEGDTWRGHMMYSANYSIKKDGSNLQLLKEEYRGYVNLYRE